MHLNVEHDSMGVLERSFELEVAGACVPGLLWSPTDATGPRPLVLMGHGGSQHKRVDTLLARARRLVRRLGFTVAAIDAPDHGDRATAEERARRVQGLQDRIAGRRPLDDTARQEGARRADQACPEWTAALDALQTVDVVGTDGPVGYWGVSMGTAIGVPFVAGEPRIRAAVLGLNGAVPGPNSLAEPAKRITIPVEFVLQADDELVTLEHGIALYDALASTEKTLHINPGGHLDTPAFEADSWMAFFARHLG
jgi:dienelactone hydrolase